MENKKKGWLSKLSESMNRTGGCNCGPGDACYVQPEEEPEAKETSCREGHEDCTPKQAQKE